MLVIIVQTVMAAAESRAKKPTKVKTLWTFDWRFSLLTKRATVAMANDSTPMPPKMNGDNSISCSILERV